MARRRRDAIWRPGHNPSAPTLSAEFVIGADAPETGRHNVEMVRDGRIAATVASLIETCRLNGVEPHAYLADVITKIINGHPNIQIDDLLPWAYSETLNCKFVA